MGGIALVLDRMWLDMARLEMRTSAEAAALAAARELVSDDLLRPTVTEDRRIARARQAARQIASENIVAGSPLELRTDPDGDVRLGHLKIASGFTTPQFVESQQDLRTAVVIARRVQDRNNPIALLINGVSPSDSANVIVTAEASIDDRIVGLRPLPGSTAPVWPLAILADDPSGARNDTWHRQIELRQGSDFYSVNELTGLVEPMPDGIPEISLSFANPTGNAALTAFRSVQPDQDLNRLILTGVEEQDLLPWNGTLIPGPQLALEAIRERTAAYESQFRQRLGICRACLLYSSDSADSKILCPRLVAGRIVECGTDGTGDLTLKFQPGVMETRSAIPATAETVAVLPDNYIYHLSLTQ